MALITVSNAGPLMVFSKLNILHLLKQLYGQVDVPFSVYSETIKVGIRHGFSDAHSLNLFLSQHQWQPTKNIKIPVDLQKARLDQGEKEAIALALSKNALLLMDEERGRDFARQKNLSIRGSLGILIEAHANQLISEDQLRFYFKQIIERKDIWINPNLCVRLLEQIFGH